MNGTEQRHHRTVTEALASRLTDDETIIAQLITQDQRLLEAGRTLTTRVGTTEETCRTRAVDAAVDHKNLADRFDQFTTRTFWPRLRWFLTGR